MTKSPLADPGLIFTATGDNEVFVRKAMGRWAGIWGVVSLRCKGGW
jgi:hypothetical protein